MIDEVVTEGPSVADAIDAALDELGVQQDAVEYEVLSEKGSSTARVRVRLRPGVLASADANPDEGDEAAGKDTGITSEAEADLTDDQLDEIADAGVAAIGAITQALGISASVEEYEGDEGEIILDIVGDELGLLIGRHGRTLDALQILVAAITNRKLGYRYPVVVDVSGYRHRRRLKLEEMATRAAERAARQGRPVQLRPMTSFERRIIHMVLRNDRRVFTESDGEEPRRMVVVHPR
jgi:spoIIIJ-associated protein